MPYQVHAPVKRQHPHTEEDVQDIPWLESWVIFLVKPQSFHVAREMIIDNMMILIISISYDMILIIDNMIMMIIPISWERNRDREKARHLFFQRW